MKSSNPRIRSLLRQADRVAQAQKRAAAEKLYRQIIEEAPDTASAWVGLGEVLSDPAEKEAAFQHALEIDPDNEHAKKGLAAISDGTTATSLDTEVKTSSVDGNGIDGLERAKDKKSQADRPIVNEAVRPLSTSEKVNETGLKSRVGQNAVRDPGSHEHADHAIEETLYCANHPRRATNLRCNRCGKPICSSCAQPTPVGYRCPECIREQEEVFFTARPVDYIIALIISLPVALVAGWLATLLGFWSIFLAAIAGSLIGRVVFWAVGRRRGRWLPQLVGAVVVIGGILPVLPLLLALFFGAPNLQLLRLLWTGIYIVTASGAAYYQMK